MSVDHRAGSIHDVFVAGSCFLSRIAWVFWHRIAVTPTVRPFGYLHTYFERITWQIQGFQVKEIIFLFFSPINLCGFILWTVPIDCFASLGATFDQKGVLRGRCNLGPCVGYRAGKDSNKCGKCSCSCPSSVGVNLLCVSFKPSSFANYSSHATCRIFLAIVSIAVEIYTQTRSLN